MIPQFTAVASLRSARASYVTAPQAPSRDTAFVSQEMLLAQAERRTARGWWCARAGWRLHDHHLPRMRPALLWLPRSRNVPDMLLTMPGFTAEAARGPSGPHRGRVREGANEPGAIVAQEDYGWCQCPCCRTISCGFLGLSDTTSSVATPRRPPARRPPSSRDDRGHVPDRGGNDVAWIQCRGWPGGATTWFRQRDRPAHSNAAIVPAQLAGRVNALRRAAPGSIRPVAVAYARSTCHCPCCQTHQGHLVCC